ncbi:hypothetical protein N7490_000873 [Penicillium lividum]|nr:hypothetical protein N7490_000873 [Penicillium lividum]
MLIAYTGLSTECQEALATNVACSTTLGIIFESNGVMTSDEVAMVCVDDCYTSLETTRTVIAAACTFSSIDTSIPTATSDPGYIYTPTYYPTAPRTLANCTAYRNYTDTTNIFFNMTDTMITRLNSCKYIAFAYQVTTDQLVEWNPSLSSNASICALQPGYSYCVLESEDSITSKDDGTCCLSINATESTTVSNCNCFTQVVGYMSTDYTCANIIDDIIEDFDSEFTEAKLVAWNPWLAGDCDTELYANITGNDKRAVCIGIDANATTTTSSPSVAPTPTDTVSGCQEYYTVVSGDDCSSILTEFGITLAQFYAWNPSIGSTCAYLWLNEAYCVKGPATTATTTTATATATSVVPTQTGIVSD